MFQEASGCSGRDCGCQVSSFAIFRKCPLCGKRLRLIGQAQQLEFRLTCQNCGYQSSPVSQEELRELL